MDHIISSNQDPCGRGGSETRPYQTLPELDAGSTYTGVSSAGPVVPGLRPDTGRLYLLIAPHPAVDRLMDALAVRLALAAKRSPEWDAARGAPRGGDINGWVRKLANDALIYEELRPVFREVGLEIRCASVEKVLILPAGKLPFFDKLREAGAQAKDKLPFDCQTWFSVSRTP